MRRADWRFLLPNQKPKRSIVFGDGILTDAVEMISESIVKAEAGYDREDCDLAVADNPNQMTLQIAWSALKPGGSLYIEWTVNKFFRTRYIQKKLEDIGFDGITYYMPKPDPSSLPSNIWIPLGHKQVIDYWIGSNYIIQREPIINKLFKKLRRYLWTLSPKLFVSFPWLISSDLTLFKVCSIASKPIVGGVVRADINITKHIEAEKPEAGKSTDTILTIIEVYLNSLGLNKKSQEISILMSTGGESLEKVVLFVFVEEDAKPLFVIKIPRTDDSAPLLANEIKTLQMLNAKCERICGIPKILFSCYTSGVFAMGETYMDGLRISNIVNKNNYREIAEKVTLWLTDLAIETKTPLPNDWEKSYIESPISDMVRSSSSILSPELIQQTSEVISTIELPNLVCEHRDFAPQNVNINSKRELRILDWDESRLNGLPALDLIFFLTYLNFHLAGEWNSINYKDCYRQMLDYSTFTGGIFNECLDHYTNTLGIPPTAIHSLRMLTWILKSHLWCNSDTHLFIELWKEEHLFFNQKRQLNYKTDSN